MYLQNILKHKTVDFYQYNNFYLGKPILNLF
jgi:hypothetical protein